MTLITSPKNPRVTSAGRLRNRRQREKTGRFLVDGIREVDRAIAGKIQLIEVFFCPGKCTEEQRQRLTAMLRDCDAELLEVSGPVFEKLAFGDRAEGVVAVAATPTRTLDELPLPEMPLVAVIEGVEKPGNVGAVLRSADGAGLNAVIVADGATDLYNPNTVRASLGALFTMSVCQATADETIAWLGEHGLAIFAARVDGSVPYADADYRPPAAIVLGSESHGLSSRWHEKNVTAIRLPMLGAADSLNISAAAAVLFYEARRQRTL